MDPWWTALLFVTGFGTVLLVLYWILTNKCPPIKFLRRSCAVEKLCRGCTLTAMQIAKFASTSDSPQQNKKRLESETDPNYLERQHQTVINIQHEATNGVTLYRDNTQEKAEEDKKSEELNSEKKNVSNQNGNVEHIYDEPRKDCYPVKSPCPLLTCNRSPLFKIERAVEIMKQQQTKITDGATSSTIIISVPVQVHSPHHHRPPNCHPPPPPPVRTTSLICNSPQIPIHHQNDQKCQLEQKFQPRANIIKNDNRSMSLPQKDTFPINLGRFRHASKSVRVKKCQSMEKRKTRDDTDESSGEHIRKSRRSSLTQTRTKLHWSSCKNQSSSGGVAVSGSQQLRRVKHLSLKRDAKLRQRQFSLDLSKNMDVDKETDALGWQHEQFVRNLRVWKEQQRRNSSVYWEGYHYYFYPKDKEQHSRRESRRWGRKLNLLFRHVDDRDDLGHENKISMFYGVPSFCNKSMEESKELFV